MHRTNGRRQNGSAAEPMAERTLMWRLALIPLVALLLSGCWFTTVEPVIHRGQQIEIASAYACVPRNPKLMARSFHLNVNDLGHNRYESQYSVYFRQQARTGAALVKFQSLGNDAVLAQALYDDLYHYLFLEFDALGGIAIFGIDRRLAEMVADGTIDTPDDVSTVPHGEDLMLDGRDDAVRNFLISDGRQIASLAIADCYALEQKPDV